MSVGKVIVRTTFQAPLSYANRPVSLESDFRTVAVRQVLRTIVPQQSDCRDPGQTILVTVHSLVQCRNEVTLQNANVVLSVVSC